MKADLPRFARQFFNSAAPMTRIGDGELGGKASGLAFIRDVLATRFPPGRFADVTVTVPTLAVITTDLFDAFVEDNGFRDIATADLPDDRIAHAFQGAELPVRLVGDLRALIAEVHSPLAVRSSSLLEDALDRPFAGVYATKMTPNNQPDVDTRFRKLVEAVKLVWASTYFAEARAYRRTVAGAPDEKMAVIIQEVVGRRFADRYYPHLAGVARSHNFYPTGHARPEDGIVELALGLGKTIVDGGLDWSYCPAYPRSPRPYNSISDLLKHSQTTFWSVNMGQPPAFDPLRETEYLVEGGLPEADADGSLRFVASTYDVASNRLSPGVWARGPRVLTFAPLLSGTVVDLNGVIRALLSECEDAVGSPVEIEFAVTLDPERGAPCRLGFLQVRPLAVSHDTVAVSDLEMDGEHTVIASDAVLGNGVDESIADVVMVKPDGFDASSTRATATDLDQINTELSADKRPYLLIGFGRWGTSDPAGGIPVNWSQISGARAIVEATLPNMDFEPSQGSHFFHNVTSFRVLYFTVRHDRGRPIDWRWLTAQRPASETPRVAHLRLATPLLVKADGRTGRGVVIRHD
jgi:hypothetical protein